MKKAFMAAPLVGLAVLALAAPPARADLGIMTCQIMVSEFAGDAARARNQLSASQMAMVRDFVDVSRSQCRSSPGIVNANLRALRVGLAVPSGPQSAPLAFDEFWPADSELAALR